MPKNVVKKLQKIENDVKRVISIYDVAAAAAHVKVNNEKPVVKNGASKLFERPIFFNKFQTDSSHNQCHPLPFEMFKKTGGFFAEFAHNIVGSEPKSVKLKKPGSAPSSSSTISTISESNHIWQSPSGFIPGTSDRELASILNVEFKGDNLSLVSDFDVHMTPSKTLETANEILARSNFTKSDENLENKQPTPPIQTPEVSTHKPQEDTASSGKSSVAPGENKIIYSLRKLKKDLEIQNKFTTNNFSYKKETPTRKEWFHPSKLLGNDKRPVDCKSPERPKTTTTAERIEKLENQKNLENQKKIYEKKEKDSKTNLTDNKLKSKESDKKTQDKKPKKLGTEQKDERNEETWANELSKVIDKSNESSTSKELALDIAKLLKDEYDEIHQTKEKLVENIKTTEKEKQKCDREIKAAKESKLKLEQQIEELKIANAKLTEEKLNYKYLMDENAALKTRISELKKQHNEELTEKQRELNKIEKERIEEIKNKEKRHLEEIQRLTTKNAELQSQVNESETKIKLLETNIRNLEEEISLEKENNKVKTERIEETNKQLEHLQKNSTDLEEQVKVLRKHIEHFDEMQKNLLKRTEEYESRIELHQTEMIKLQEENTKLKMELNNEKDSLLIKTKIIEDQQGTIQQLREKSEEVKTLQRKNESLERIISMEREEKLELQEAVKCLKWRKEELKKKIKSLENDLLLAPQEVVKDLQKTQVVLHELENQVQTKQKEWEHQLQSLIKEKKQACSVAEFAAKKLVQTTNEYQKQSEAFKKLRKLLTEALSNKEKNWREIVEKASQIQGKQFEPHIDNKITTGDKHQFIVYSGDERKVPCCFTNRQKTNLNLS